MELEILVARLDVWLDTMRSDSGYGGPVVHWWQNCFQYTGTGLDWRYEGIILGYLNLHARTHERRWLVKAQRAGDDLVRGHLESGNYRNSSFELNPYTGGTPHEAAAGIGLLALAERLREEGDSASETYLSVAKRNIDSYYIGTLWDGEMFRDNPAIPSFVPNKSATLTEALFKLAFLTGDERYITQYALPTLETLLKYQVSSGAIYQNMLRAVVVAKFFPYYVARCVPALLLGYTHTGEERFAAAAQAALKWVFQQRTANGGFAQVVYQDGRRNIYQQWIAAAGDIANIAHLAGFTEGIENVHEWIVDGLQPSGGVATAHGFGAQISQRSPGLLQDFRDLLPVCGWADKTFCYLTGRLSDGAAIEAAPIDLYESDCLLRGKVRQYREDATSITLSDQKGIVYQWIKGEDWAHICRDELLWR